MVDALSRASASSAKTTKPPALSNKIRGMLANHRIHLHFVQWSNMTKPVSCTVCFLLICAGPPGHTRAEAFPASGP